jgi:hypothetical protein
VGGLWPLHLEEMGRGVNLSTDASCRGCPVMEEAPAVGGGCRGRMRFPDTPSNVPLSGLCLFPR